MINRVIIAILLLLLGSPFLEAQTAAKVERVSITVSDLDQILPFYQEILPFKHKQTFEVSGPELQRLGGIQNDHLKAQIAQLSLGEEVIELIEFDREKQSRPIPLDSKSNDLWFHHIAIVVNDMDKAYQGLWNNEVTHVSTAPQTLPDYIPAAAGISAFYFQDPDRHNLELIYFPEGKGDPRWQQASDQPFLGIDHTAIGISSTKKSTRFYEDLIGLKVAGSSENYGTEQEHLNQVFGARLLITGLKAKEGFGVEFLNYIAPPGGRPYPTDSQITDLWHWHITIRVSDIESVFKALIENNANLISNGLVSFTDPNLDYSKAFMVRDPDGHALLVIE